MTGLDVEVPGLHFSYVYSVCCQFATFTVSLKVIPTLVLAHFGPCIHTLVLKNGSKVGKDRHRSGYRALVALIQLFNDNFCNAYILVNEYNTHACSKY